MAARQPAAGQQRPGRTIGGALPAIPGAVRGDVDLDAGRADVLCEKAVPDSAPIGPMAHAGHGFPAAAGGH